MLAASLDTSVPVIPIATPTSAFFKAGASLTPSPVIDTIRSFLCHALTILILFSGKKPSSKPGQKPNGKSGKSGPNTQSYDYKSTLKASLNVKSGTTKVGKKTITNNKTDQNVALVQKNGKLSLDGTK